MTYFLALAAGLPADVANKIATATQYIDENKLTSPIAGAASGSLPKYHFVLDYSTGNHGDTSTDPLARMMNPYSAQLQRLHGITDPGTLERLWREAHPPRPPELCPTPDQSEIRNARYQLYGEYLHAYQDTFSHRDTANMPYDIFSINDGNVPKAVIGHVGPDVPDNGHAPDHSFNQRYEAESKCTTQAPGLIATFPYSTELGLTREACDRRNGYFTPPGEMEWKYNEVRTLRMEWEVFNRFSRDFGQEIQSNLARGGTRLSWRDLTGTDYFDSGSARIGTAESLPHDAVLQRFNAAPDAEKLQILNDWLIDHGIEETIPSLDGSSLRDHEQAAQDRKRFLKWIPHRAEREYNILLPRTRRPLSGG
jgi:hypothetical protein